MNSYIYEYQSPSVSLHEILSALVIRKKYSELQTLHKEGDNREIQQGDAIWLLRVMIEQPICPKVGSWSLSVQTSYKSIRK